MEGCSCWPSFQGSQLSFRVARNKKDSLFRAMGCLNHYKSNLTRKPQGWVLTVTPIGDSQGKPANLSDIQRPWAMLRGSKTPILGFLGFFTKPSFFVPPLIPPTSHPLPPWHHPLTSPTCCWLLAQSRHPPPPPLGKKVWPPTCIGLALCCPSSMRNLLLVGFLPILYKPPYVQSSKCYCVIIDINRC